MPKVSIIIPVYNVEKYLQRCLDSVVNQTLKDIEIICVNDGSTDNSAIILEEFSKKDERIKIVNQKNGGLSRARNTGLEHSNGDYIGFLDSDDWIDLDYYEKLHDAAERNNCDIAFADFIRKGKNKHKIRFKLTEEKVFTDQLEKIREAKIFSCGACVWNKIYKKDLIFNNNLMFPEGRFFEDGIFTAKAIYYSNKLVCVPNTYAYYFVNPASIVKSKKIQKKIDDLILTQHEIIEFFNKNNVQLEEDEYESVMYKMRLFFLTLWAIKENALVKKYYLFGSILVAKLHKGNAQRHFLNVLGLKFTIRKKRYSKKELLKINSIYEDLNSNATRPIVKNAKETLHELTLSNKSIARFGDGEFNLLFKEALPFQKYDANLREKLLKVVKSDDKDIMVGIPDCWGKVKIDFWRKYAVYNREKVYNYLSISKNYYDTNVTRFYIDLQDVDFSKDVANSFKKIWQGKDIVFVEGKASRLGVGNDLFSGARSIKRILCPAKDAFDKYDEIFEACKTVSKDKLFILALGPTATVLAYDLAKEGYRALDLGHIDIEYEWFLMGATKKVPIKNKYVNETKKGKVITEFNDEKYLSEIYKDLS